MTEKYIKQKALVELQKDGWLSWCPIRNRWMKVDVFNCFDSISLGMFGRTLCVLFVQWTSVGNISARVKKIEAWKKKNGFAFRGNTFAQVWGLRKDKTFKKVSL